MQESRNFWKKGFQAASFRNIVKNAGVTTGAFYGYYKSKEELFEALVKEPADFL
ncbi:MAG: TetR/AcrR family transcriptional regulator [Coprococcus phoceensis]